MSGLRRGAYGVAFTGSALLGADFVLFGFATMWGGGPGYFRNLLMLGGAALCISGVVGLAKVASGAECRHVLMTCCVFLAACAGVCAFNLDRVTDLVPNVLR
jgi:hypothetical protein